MEERKENSQENREVRPLARLLARELSQDEVSQISAGYCRQGPSGKCLDWVSDAQL